MSSAEQDAIALLEQHAPAAQIGECINATSSWATLPLPTWLSILSALSRLASSPLDWLAPDQQGWLRDQAKRRLLKTLLEGRPDEGPALNDVRSATESFTDWIATQSDYDVVEFCWLLLSRQTSGMSLRDPVWALHQGGRLFGEIALENIELAISFQREASDMFTVWPEERWALVKWPGDSERFFPALSHASYLVRSNAAKALGELYIGCINAGHRGLPSGAHILTLVGNLERKTAGIAGPFLFGAHWDWEREKFATNGFDVRRWFLDTLRNSERERNTPGTQTLEFHAHEFFQDDAEAIRAMLAMGRRNLAILTATQCPNAINTMRNLLDLMAQSDDQVVSRAIQTYLRERRHHAGCEFLPYPWFGQ